LETDVLALEAYQLLLGTLNALANLLDKLAEMDVQVEVEIYREPFETTLERTQALEVALTALGILQPLEVDIDDDDAGRD
jgi:hypothetical protein